MESPLIANGAEIFRIGGGVKVEKSNGMYRCHGETSIIPQGRL
jgi:hypothetical protein